MIKIKKGLDLPISGAPQQTRMKTHVAKQVAIVGADFPGLKPTLLVAVGDNVQQGQPLFSDKKNEGVTFNAPASGRVSAIHRGAKRVFQSLVIEVDESDPVQFERYEAAALGQLSREAIVDQLMSSGEWTALRTRPFNKIPAPDTQPSALFITAMDTRPHAPDANVVIDMGLEAFQAGLTVLSRLTDGATYLCCDENGRDPKVAGITVQRFSGCHPAGLVGTHIHYLSPVNAEKTVWHAHYQDVLAIGRLFLTGQVDAERIIALAGPAVIEPQLVKTSRGASLAHMTEDGLKPGHHRIISGSVLDGRSGAPEEAYLGRYHLQVAALSEGTEREFFGFVAPGGSKFSMTRLFTAWLRGRREFDLTTSTGGSERSMIPLGSFERLAALDILPTQLLRALLVDDVESSIELGCLELDEEDIALFTFACPGKYEYGPYLRSMLTKIEVEG